MSPRRLNSSSSYAPLPESKYPSLPWSPVAAGFIVVDASWKHQAFLSFQIVHDTSVKERVSRPCCCWLVHNDRSRRQRVWIVGAAGGSCRPRAWQMWCHTSLVYGQHAIIWSMVSIALITEVALLCVRGHGGHGGHRSSVSFWMPTIKRSWRATVPKSSRSNVGLEILSIQNGVIIIDSWV